jgi:hypothetical protein
VCTCAIAGVTRQHRRRLAVDERVDREVRRRALQHREDGRCKQHVAVMAKLGDERALDVAERNGVRQRACHVVHNTKRSPWALAAMS